MSNKRITFIHSYKKLTDNKVNLYSFGKIKNNILGLKNEIHNPKNNPGKYSFKNLYHLKNPERNRNSWFFLLYTPIKEKYFLNNKILFSSSEGASAKPLPQVVGTDKKLPTILLKRHLEDCKVREIATWVKPPYLKESEYEKSIAPEPGGKYKRAA